MKYLFTILLFISTALIAIAQAPTPHVDPNFNPCGADEKYNTAANTCEHSWSKFMWHDGGWVFILLLVGVPVAIFVGRRYFGWFGGKSVKTPRPS